MKTLDHTLNQPTMTIITRSAAFLLPINRVEDEQFEALLCKMVSDQHRKRWSKNLSRYSSCNTQADATAVRCCRIGVDRFCQ